jgi:hypothetical protein
MLLVLLGGLEVWQVVAGHVLLPASMVAAGILGCLAGICLLNRGFYRFFVSLKGRRFSLFAVSMYILYCIYSGASFALGAGLYGWRTILPKSTLLTSASEIPPARRDVAEETPSFPAAP